MSTIQNFFFTLSFCLWQFLNKRKNKAKWLAMTKWHFVPRTKNENWIEIFPHKNFITRIWHSKFRNASKFWWSVCSKKKVSSQKYFLFYPIITFVKIFCKIGLKFFAVNCFFLNFVCFSRRFLITIRDWLPFQVNTFHF